MAHNIPTYIIAGLIVLQTGAASVDAVKLYVWHKDPTPISGEGIAPNLVHAGETVQIDWTLLKTVDCNGTSSRVWHGTNDFLLVEPSRPTTIPASPEAQHVSVSTHIPAEAPLGPLHLSVVGSYDCSDILGERQFELGPVVMEVVE